MCYYLVNCGPLWGWPPNCYPHHDGISARKLAVMAESSSIQSTSLFMFRSDAARIQQEGIIKIHRKTTNIASNSRSRLHVVNVAIAIQQHIQSIPKHHNKSTVNNWRLPIYRRPATVQYQWATRALSTLCKYIMTARTHRPTMLVISSAQRQ